MTWNSSTICQWGLKHPPDRVGQESTGKPVSPEEFRNGVFKASSRLKLIGFCILNAMTRAWYP